MPGRKRRQKGLRVSDFALLLVVFRIHHGSEGVKPVVFFFFFFFVVVVVVVVVVAAATTMVA